MYGGRVDTTWHGHNVDTQIQLTSLNLIRSGFYAYDSGNNNDIAASGWFWLKSNNAKSIAQHLVFYPSGLYPYDSRFVGYGFSVRCLVPLLRHQELSKPIG